MYKIGDKFWTTANTNDEYELQILEPRAPWQCIITNVDNNWMLTEYTVNMYSYDDDTTSDSPYCEAHCGYASLFKNYEDANKSYEKDLEGHIRYLKMRLSEWEELLVECKNDKRTNKDWFPYGTVS